MNDKYHERISAVLLEEIETFDREIGGAVIALCKKPKKLNETQARDIVEKHSEVLGRAYHGTTLTLALANRNRGDLWVAGVGDSTVGEFGKIAVLDMGSVSYSLNTSSAFLHKSRWYPKRRKTIGPAHSDYAF